uniref:Uncharacterized protein n=1 Tax=Anguilla anguilla TaxID=7936 RepID=A0A0E9Q4N8_ANGAN
MSNILQKRKRKTGPQKYTNPSLLKEIDRT